MVWGGGGRRCGVIHSELCTKHTQILQSLNLSEFTIPCTIVMGVDKKINFNTA